MCCKTWHSMWLCSSWWAFRKGPFLLCSENAFQLLCKDFIINSGALIRNDAYYGTSEMYFLYGKTSSFCLHIPMFGEPENLKLIFFQLLWVTKQCVLCSV